MVVGRVGPRVAATVVLLLAVTACRPLAAPAEPRAPRARGLAAGVLTHVPRDEVRDYAGEDGPGGTSASVGLTGGPVTGVDVFAMSPAPGPQPSCRRDPGTVVVSCEDRDGFEVVVLRRADGAGVDENGFIEPLASGYAGRSDGSSMGVEVFAGNSASTSDSAAAVALARALLEDQDVGWDPSAKLRAAGAALPDFERDHDTLVVSDAGGS